MRMINADDLERALRDIGMLDVIKGDVKFTSAWGVPIVDAEPVVRCKDCKFNYANQIPSGDECQLCVELPISKDFFCAYGEKMDEANE